MTNQAKELSKMNGREFLKKSFNLQQQLLASQLNLSRTITHNGTMGEVNESYFLSIIRQYLPERYSVDRGIVLDSEGQTSDQIDAVIFDRHYTPTLLDQQGHRFIPAEAVYAVLEVKPTINKTYLDYAADKAASVRKLYRTSTVIKNIYGTAKPVEHFPIVAGIVAIDVEWQDGLGKAFTENLQAISSDKNRKLDCGLAVSGECFDSYDDAITIKSGENALIFFLFRLLGKLQSLGTVPAIDWRVYINSLE